MIVFERVSKYYPKNKFAIRDFSLIVHEGERLVLLGTSGSGKSTTIKMINRLIDPDEGTIYIQGEDILKQDLIELRRKIGYAIQEIGLFPHMTVEENIRIVPKLLGWSKKKIDKRIDYLITILGMDPQVMRTRYPRELSGGQKQRIGVARALAADPPILLMDEPFGALDPITRQQVQDEFCAIGTQMKKTVIFVTHDLFEAVTIGDRIGLMDKGELLQVTTSSEFVSNPPSAFADQFVGEHRFQLSLLNRSIVDYIDPPLACQKASKANQLTIQSSFSEALNLFRNCADTSLPVYSGANYCGELKKEKLLDEILNLLMKPQVKG